MVEELINPNVKGKQSVMNIDVESLGEAADQNIMASSSDQEKVILEEPVRGRVIGMELILNNQLRVNDSDINKKYYPVRLMVSTEFEDPKTGDKVISRDGFGGLRFYPAFDESGNVKLKENGEPVLDHFWFNSSSSKQASGFSILFGRAQDFDATILSASKLFKFLNSNPNCMLLTEYTAFQGEDLKPKQVIQSFVE